MRRAFKAQYASLILAADEDQLAVARESATRLEGLVGGRPATRIERLDRFWMAEDYHQKYYLRNDWRLAAEFGQMYARDEDFVASTAAARVNGYLYGAGSCLQLEQEIAGLGLSDAGEEHLLTHCRH